MGEDAEQHLAVLGVVAPGAQRCTEHALVARDHALRLSPLPIAPAGEAAKHLRAVVAGGPLPGRAPGIELDHRQADLQLAPGQAMIRLAVEACVGGQAVEVQVLRCLAQRRGEVRRVLARPAARDRAGDEVGGGVADHGQLGPRRVRRGPTVRAAAEVVAADVMAFQSRGVDGAGGPLVDQAARAGAVEDGPEERDEAPFFSRRRSA